MACTISARAVVVSLTAVMPRTKTKGSASLPPLGNHPKGRAAASIEDALAWDEKGAAQALQEAASAGKINAEALRRLMRVGLGADPLLPVADSYGATLGLYLPGPQRAALTRSAQEALKALHVDVKVKKGKGRPDEESGAESTAVDVAALQDELSTSRREAHELHLEVEKMKATAEAQEARNASELARVQALLERQMLAYGADTDTSSSKSSTLEGMKGNLVELIIAAVTGAPDAGAPLEPSTSDAALGGGVSMEPELEPEPEPEQVDREQLWQELSALSVGRSVWDPESLLFRAREAGVDGEAIEELLDADSRDDRKYGDRWKHMQLADVQHQIGSERAEIEKLRELLATQKKVLVCAQRSAKEEADTHLATIHDLTTRNMELQTGEGKKYRAEMDRMLGAEKQHIEEIAELGRQNSYLKNAGDAAKLENARLEAEARAHAAEHQAGQEALEAKLAKVNLENEELLGAEQELEALVAQQRARIEELENELLMLAAASAPAPELEPEPVPELELTAESQVAAVLVGLIYQLEVLAGEAPAPEPEPEPELGPEQEPKSKPVEEGKKVSGKASSSQVGQLLRAKKMARKLKGKRKNKSASAT